MGYQEKMELVGGLLIRGEGEPLAGCSPRPQRYLQKKKMGKALRSWAAWERPMEHECQPWGILETSMSSLTPLCGLKASQTLEKGNKYYHV